MKTIAVAIDGPAGAGKSTIARLVASKLGILYIDTGAMYRAVTLYIIRSKTDINNLENIKKIIDEIDINISHYRVYLNGEDVSEEIRSPEVNLLVSEVSAIPCVREKLVDLQRKIASYNSVIMDGRDIGTNVLKDADIKIFLTASIEERARRRHLEEIQKGRDVDYETIRQQISERDKFDSSREINPLKKAPDALVIDSTSETIESVVDKILDIIKKRWYDAV